MRNIQLLALRNKKLSTHVIITQKVYNKNKKYSKYKISILFLLACTQLIQGHKIQLVSIGVQVFYLLDLYIRMLALVGSNAIHKKQPSYISQNKQRNYSAWLSINKNIYSKVFVFHAEVISQWLRVIYRRNKADNSNCSTISKNKSSRSICNC